MIGIRSVNPLFFIPIVFGEALLVSHDMVYAACCTLALMIGGIVVLTFLSKLAAGRSEGKWQGEVYTVYFAERVRWQGSFKTYFMAVLATEFNAWILDHFVVHPELGVHYGVRATA